MQKLVGILLLAIALTVGVRGHAEMANIFNPTKPATESIIAGLEGCQKGFEKGRRQSGRWTGSKSDQLLSLLFCGCQFDAKQKYPSPGFEANAQKCIDDASIKVNQSKSGLPYQLNNIFDSNDYAHSEIQTAFYVCEKTEAINKNHNWPKKFGQKSAYCSCLIDYLQDKKDLSLTKYADGKQDVEPSVDQKCVQFAKVRK